METFFVMKPEHINEDVSGLRQWLTFTSATDVAFALRTTVAGIAALYTAMWLQLDVPRWAMWTVFIVSPPVRGNALRKTASRLVGTTIGCIVALVAVGLFPQQPAAYYLVFSAWLGGCAYWGTLRRGYVSYAASLAAFTSAIVAANVASAPLNVWQTATDRGSATVLGILFALVASDIASRSDDVPVEFARRIGALAADLLDWAVRQLELIAFDEPKDAPFTAKILGLDEICTNAVAERRALHWVKSWIRGIPTALLSLQSAVLSIRGAASRQDATRANACLLTDALQGVAVFLRSSAALDLPSLRRQADSLAELRQASWAQASAHREIIDALVYLLGGLEAILTLHPPDAVSPLYPQPKFVAHRSYATTNLIRTVLGMLLGFVIWDVTAWADGATFLVNVAVALVIFVTLDDPVSANRPNIIGNLIGGVVAMPTKYLLLVHENDPLSLAIVLFLLMFIGAWAETKPRLASLGLFYMNGLLVLMEPKNPQQYDFVQDVNVLIALVVAYAFVPLVFLAIGAPRKGPERAAELLARMRRNRCRGQSFATRQQRLRWETQMYDELQRLQAVTNNPRDREIGVNLLLSGLRAPETGTSAPVELAMN
jgi:uncharacterized membrane protein YccC